MPLIEHQIRADHIDKLLVQNGQKILASESTSHLRCDEATQVTLREMELKEIAAFHA
jgi:hypothetical protein